MGRAKYYKRMRLQVGNETTQRHLPVYQHHKDQTAKARSLGIKCVSLLDINVDGVSSAKLYQQRISRLHVVMKKIYNFHEKSELPKLILPVKISWLTFSAVSGLEMKHLQRSEQAHFHISRLRRQISRAQLSCSRVFSNVSLLAG